LIDEVLTVSQAEGWIEDKLTIAKEESFKNVRDIQEKMKSLKKHQAFEAEIMANAERIRAIKQVCICWHDVCYTAVSIISMQFKLPVIYLFSSVPSLL